MFYIICIFCASNFQASDITLANGSVPVCVYPPTIDGDDIDMAWRTSEEFGNVSKSGEKVKPFLRMICDENFLYFYGIAKSKMVILELGPAPELRIKIAIRKDGASADYKWNGEIFDPSWKSRKRVATSKNKNGSWNFELKLPRASVSAATLHEGAGIRLRLSHLHGNQDSLMLNADRGAGLVLGKDIYPLSLADNDDKILLNVVDKLGKLKSILVSAPFSNRNVALKKVMLGKIDARYQIDISMWGSQAFLRIILMDAQGECGRYLLPNPRLLSIDPVTSLSARLEEAQSWKPEDENISKALTALRNKNLLALSKPLRAMLVDLQNPKAEPTINKSDIASYNKMMMTYLTTKKDSGYSQLNSDEIKAGYLLVCARGLRIMAVSSHHSIIKQLLQMEETRVRLLRRMAFGAGMLDASPEVAKKMADFRKIDPLSSHNPNETSDLLMFSLENLKAFHHPRGDVYQNGGFMRALLSLEKLIAAKDKENRFASSSYFRRSLTAPMTYLARRSHADSSLAYQVAMPEGFMSSWAQRMNGVSVIARFTPEGQRALPEFKTSPYDGKEFGGMYVLRDGESNLSVSVSSSQNNNANGAIGISTDNTLLMGATLPLKDPAITHAGNGVKSLSMPGFVLPHKLKTSALFSVLKMSYASGSRRVFMPCGKNSYVYIRDISDKKISAHFPLKLDAFSNIKLWTSGKSSQETGNVLKIYSSEKEIATVFEIAKSASKKSLALSNSVSKLNAGVLKIKRGSDHDIIINKSGGAYALQGNFAWLRYKNFALSALMLEQASSLKISGTVKWEIKFGRKVDATISMKKGSIAVSVDKAGSARAVTLRISRKGVAGSASATVNIIPGKELVFGLM